MKKESTYTIIDETLNKLIKSHPDYNKEDLKILDDHTINRTSFDFYSWEYWGKSKIKIDSISAYATDIYNKYKRFRNLQNSIPCL